MASLKGLIAISAILALTPTPVAAISPKWRLLDDYFDQSPASFFKKFTWFTEPDPTNGMVIYTDQKTAEADKLVGFLPPAAHTPSKFQVFMGLDRNADNTPKRKSVRIQSTKKYNAPLLVVVDVSHIPTGPGTWPAFWLNGADGVWPSSGEIDIIEQVSSFQGGPSISNAMTLHTTPGCSLQSNQSGTAYQGTLHTQDCDAAAPNQDKNAGCQIQAPSGLATFGTAFNAAKGGSYVTEWTDQGIKIWFFDVASRPTALSSASPDTSTLGKPMASFTGAGCDFKRHFRDMQIIFSNTICGDWAGNTWSGESQCKQFTGVATCEEAVRSGKGLGEAYWTVGGLKVFGA